jgi:hypothetical protein
LNQNRDIERLSVGVAEFVMMKTLFVTNEGGVVFCRKEKEEEEEEEMGEGGRLTYYNLNISDEFTDKY